jgi:hypothetical protein
MCRAAETISVAVSGHRGRVLLLGWGNPLSAAALPRSANPRRKVTSSCSPQSHRPAAPCPLETDEYASGNAGGMRPRVAEPQ